MPLLQTSKNLQIRGTKQFCLFGKFTHKNTHINKQDKIKRKLYNK